jgi:uncharacterized protein
MQLPSALAPLRFLPRLCWALLLTLACLLPAQAALAMGVQEFPASPPLNRVLDTADLLSRASITDLDHRLAALEDDHIQARLVTLRRLDYGLDLGDLGDQLLDRWQGDGKTTADGQLLFLIEAQNNTAAVVVSNDLLDQLPAGLLSSTGTSTMGLPLREGARYRQASIDGIDRLASVLRDGQDPGPPQLIERLAVESNVPSRDETQSSNALTWVVVLLTVGTLVPMITWWVFSR